AAPKLAATRHLDVSSSARSSARASVASVRRTAAAPARSEAPAAPAVPKLASAGFGSHAVASIHYGVSDRSELMGNAAGPVYNFAGSKSDAKSAALMGPIAGPAATAAAFGEVRKQLDDPNLSPADRARLQQALTDAQKASTDSSGAAAAQ
ncbi:MAG: hypothetical protein KGM24_06660, partial [Elusimicrobia bacterium]|nr:hypothetical protein [Elusimicrobiota bacterium]